MRRDGFFNGVGRNSTLNSFAMQDTRNSVAPLSGTRATKLLRGTGRETGLETGFDGISRATIKVYLRFIQSMS